MAKTSKAVAKEMRKQNTREAMAKRAEKRGKSSTDFAQQDDDFFPYADPQQEWDNDFYTDNEN